MWIQSLLGVLILCLAATEKPFVAGCQTDVGCSFVNCFVGRPVCRSGTCTCSGFDEILEKRKEKRSCRGNFECMLLTDCFLGQATCESGSCSCSKIPVMEMGRLLPENNAKRQITFTRPCFHQYECACFRGWSHCLLGKCICTTNAPATVSP